MNLVTKISDHVGETEEKFFKTTLFSSDTLLLGLNCFRPGQVQRAHVHDDQDKFYYVVEGEGHFWLGEKRLVAGAGMVDHN